MNLQKLKDKAQNAINAGRDKVKINPEYLLKLIAGYKAPEQTSVLNTTSGDYEFLLSVCEQKSTGNFSVSEIAEKFVEFVKNTDNNYEQRVKIWKEAPAEFVPTKGYFTRFRGVPRQGEFSFYDDFSIDRGQDQDVRELLEMSIFEDEDSVCEFGYESCDEMVKHFIDHCMEKGIFIINYDW